MRVGPSRPSPIRPARPGPPARAYSSWKMTSWLIGSPRPPCSVGQPTHVHRDRGEVTLPLHALRDEHVLVAGAAADAELGELAGEVRRHPVADLGAELGIGL